MSLLFVLALLAIELFIFNKNKKIKSLTYIVWNLERRNNSQSMATSLPIIIIMWSNYCGEWTNETELEKNNSATNETEL